MMSTYSVWHDHASGTYEVVMWNDRHPTVIQSNIKTQEKAHKARDRWQAKEDRSAPRSSQVERAQ